MEPTDKRAFINNSYRFLLNREMNPSEIVATDAMLEADGAEFDLHKFRRTMISSGEFVVLHRELLMRTMFPKPCIVVARNPTGQELFVDLRQLHLGFAIATGSFEPSESAFVQRSVQRGMYVCDVGANLGYYTTMFGGLVGDSGMVDAFEPVGETYRYLTAAVDRNRLQHVVRARRVVVADKTGEAEIEFEVEGLNIGSAHLVESDAVPSEQCRVERVAAMQLDELTEGRRVDFIKIDVEGAEMMVLNGAPRILVDSRPLIMIELNVDQLRSVSHCTPLEVADRLEQLGYILHEINQDGTTEPLSDTAEGLERLLGPTGICNCVAYPPAR